MQSGLELGETKINKENFSEWSQICSPQMNVLNTILIISYVEEIEGLINNKLENQQNIKSSFGAPSFSLFIPLLMHH